LYLFKFSGISFLWYNVIGSLVVIATGLLLSAASPQRGSAHHGQTA
jgi:hypothetical protein